MRKPTNKLSNHRLPASKAREKFADVLNAVSVKGDRVLLHRHGKNVAALISAEDLELLEALEDKYDVEMAREAIAESDDRITWEQLKVELHL